MPTWLSDGVTTLFRVVVGLLFVTHGLSSVFGVLGGHLGSGEPVPFAEWPSWWAALIQLVGGVLVLSGLVTRIAAVICSGSMAYAYFVVHQPEGLLPLQNGGELAALFCWSFLIVAVLGPSRWSVDELLARRRGDRLVGSNLPEVREPGD